MATTPLTWDQFRTIPNGTQILNHYADECVALANLFQEGVLRRPFVAINSAYQWWTLYHALPALHNTYRQSQTPIAGGVIVSRGGIYNSKDGHIGVILEVYGDGTFLTLEQNAGHGAQRYVYRYRRDMRNVLGILHPINNPATQEEDDMYSDADRNRDNLVAAQVADTASLVLSIKRAIFDINIEDFGPKTGGIGREILRLRDSQFLKTETSFGTPGGTLESLKAILDLLEPDADK